MARRTPTWLIAIAIAFACRGQPQASTASQFPPLVVPGLPSLSVTSYGADPTGLTDSTAALASALSGVSGTGKVLLFPPGTYLVQPSGNGCTGGNNAITLSTVTNLYMYGPGATIKWNTDNCNLFYVPNGSSQIKVEGLFFQGLSTDDSYLTNVYAAFNVADAVTDFTVVGNTFDHVTPMAWIESNPDGGSSRLHFVRNYVHNAPNGLHPPSHTMIEDNDFIEDEYLSTRAEQIYAYGSQADITITGNRFKNGTQQDIQIRSSEPLWWQKYQFTITNNYFENSHGYSIWLGSDTRMNGAAYVVTGNRFRNSPSPVYIEGADGAVISDNEISFDWAYPYGDNAGGAIIVNGGPGLESENSNTKGNIVSNNHFINRHPWLASVTITNQPSNGDQLVIGDMTYTFRTTPSVSYDVQIGSTTRITTDNLRQTVQGIDGLASSMCNVLRYTTDAFNALFGETYTNTEPTNVLYIASGSSFSMSTTDSSAITLSGSTATQNQPDAYGIQVNKAMNVVVAGNVFDDWLTGITVQQSYAPMIKDNVLTVDGNNFAQLIAGIANVFSTYRNNRMIFKSILNQGRNYSQAQISDGFPDIDDEFEVRQQLTSPAFQGSHGYVAIGNGSTTGQAYTLLFYGQEVVDTGPSTGTLPWRWNDGDAINLYNGSPHVFTFKRTSPSGSQFNTAAGLVSLINATGVWTASYMPINNDLGATNPDIWLVITAVNGGTGDNTDELIVERFKDPNTSSGNTWERTEQPLTVGVCLRNHLVPNVYCSFAGGGTALSQTFVFTQRANPEHGVSVWGADSASVALSPVVYASNIIPGVGFLITHSAGSGSEHFFWRTQSVPLLSLLAFLPLARRRRRAA